jgi:hypothetical protein
MGVGAKKSNGDPKQNVVDFCDIFKNFYISTKNRKNASKKFRKIISNASSLF